MRPKKVMYLIKGLGRGGAEQLLSTAIPYLDRQTFQYEVAYLLPEKNDLVQQFAQADIPVFCLNSERAYDLTVIVRLVKLLKERNIDILHVHLPFTGILGRISAQLAGVSTVVYTEHNQQEMYHPVTRFLNGLTYPLNSANIMVSQEVLESSLRSRMFRPKDARVIPGGVDFDDIRSKAGTLDRARIRAALGIPEGHLVVGNVAHIRPEKGHVYLLEAAARVLERYPQTAFVVVGRGKEKGDIPALQSKAEGLGIQNKVIFTGFREDAAEIMRIFDVFTLSSLHEGLPIALLESMALGVPPVCTAVGGIPEVIEDGIDGYLVEAKNAQALSEKIGLLLENTEMREEMSRKAAKKVQQHFSIQSMVGAVEQVYAAALAHQDLDGVRVA